MKRQTLKQKRDSSGSAPAVSKYHAKLVRQGRVVDQVKHWYFDTTRDAYDACQCNEEIKDGDTLIIKSEGVIGLAGCWPVAITRKFGGLHTMKSGYPLQGRFTTHAIAAAERHAARLNFALGA